MALRNYRTKKEALKRLKEITPSSYGTPKRRLIKRVWKTKKGWTGSVKAS